MFPSFTSLSQRESKRQELLRQAEKELAIERQLDQRYAEAMWAADNESGLIDLSKPTTAQTMTTASTPIPANISRDINVPVPTANQPTSGFINLTDIPATPASAPTATETPGVFSAPDVEMKPDQPNEGGLPDAYYGVRAFLTKFPQLMSNRVNPIFKKGVSKRSKTYFFGRVDAQILRTNDRKYVGDAAQQELEREIDWESTREYMKKRLLSVGEEREVIMKAFNALRSNVVRSKTQRTASERFSQLSERQTSAALESEAKYAIQAILTTNRADLKRVELTPIGKDDGSVMNESYKLDSRTLELSRDGEPLPDPQANQLVSWERTLFKFLTDANAAKIPLDIPQGVNVQYSVQKRSLADSAVSEGVSQPDTTRPRARSDVDSGEIAYESKIKFIFINNSWINDYEVISPVGPDGFVQNYMFAGDGSLVKRGSMKSLTAADRASEAYGQIQWEATYHRLIETLNEASRVISNRPANSVNTEMKQMRNDINRTLTALNEQKKSIEGRGLTGAGYINKELRDRDGNLIKYHSNKGYNLAQLEGTGNASALAYKRIGTKFLHLPKLNEHLLKVVYPNRSAVGAQKRISAELAQLIKTLVFDGTIDNQLYESLPLADKRVFHELLRITHTQSALRDPVKDPRDVLKQEYIKLKGELMLGNDNPAMIRELKQVLVDMYSAKLISDDEFKQVLVALV